MREQRALPPPRPARDGGVAAKRDFAREPTVTAAMGMKPDEASRRCWHVQCLREERIRREWERLFLPAARDGEDAVLERRLRAEAAAAAEAQRASHAERRALFDGVSKDGKGRLAYLKARREMSPQQRFGDALPATAAQAVGWTADRHRGDPAYGPLGGSYGRRGFGPSVPVTIQLM